MEIKNVINQSFFIIVENGKPLFDDVIFLRKVMDAKSTIAFQALRQYGYWYIGCSSYITFPIPLELSSNIQYQDKLLRHDFLQYSHNLQNLIGWLHGFRPSDEHYIHAKIPIIPRLFLSESDLVSVDLSLVDNPDSEQLGHPGSPEQLSPEQLGLPVDTASSKRYDFLYCCHKGAHQRFWRNWEQAQHWLAIMIEKNLKVVLVGKKDDEYKETPETAALLEHPNITTTSLLPQRQLYRLMAQCKSLFVPNIYDASPRIVTEAMSLNVSVFENKDIKQGWYYFTPNATHSGLRAGRSFTEDTFNDDLTDFIQTRHKYQPARWFEDHQKKKLVKFRNFIGKLEKPYFAKHNRHIKTVIVTVVRNDKHVGIVRLFQSFRQELIEKIRGWMGDVDVFIHQDTDNNGHKRILCQSFNPSKLSGPIMVMTRNFDFTNIEGFHHYYDLFVNSNAYYLDHQLVLSGKNAVHARHCILDPYLYLHSVKSISGIGAYIVKELKPTYAETISLIRKTDQYNPTDPLPIKLVNKKIRVTNKKKAYLKYSKINTAPDVLHEQFGTSQQP